MLREHGRTSARLHRLIENRHTRVRAFIRDARGLRLFDGAQDGPSVFRLGRIFLGVRHVDPLSDAAEVEERPGEHWTDEQPRRADAPERIECRGNVSGPRA